jgi:hypothetical protein
MDTDLAAWPERGPVCHCGEGGISGRRVACGGAEQRDELGVQSRCGAAGAASDRRDAGQGTGGSDAQESGEERSAVRSSPMYQVRAHAPVKGLAQPGAAAELQPATLVTTALARARAFVADAERFISCAHCGQRWWRTHALMHLRSVAGTPSATHMQKSIPRLTRRRPR